jgi:tetratricopeptide (TPR) repeat protein
LGNRGDYIYNTINLGGIARERGDRPAAQSLFEEALAFGREFDDKLVLASCFYHLGLLAEEQGNRERARLHYQESLAIQRELGIAPGIAMCLQKLEGIAAAREEPSRPASTRWGQDRRVQ